MAIERVRLTGLWLKVLPSVLNRTVLSLEDFRECVEKSSNDFKNQLGVDPPESTLAALQLSLDAFSAQGWNIQLQQQCCDTVATTMLVGIEKISTY